MKTTIYLDRNSSNFFFILKGDVYAAWASSPANTHIHPCEIVSPDDAPSYLIEYVRQVLQDELAPLNYPANFFTADTEELQIATFENSEYTVTLTPFEGDKS